MFPRTPAYRWGAVAAFLLFAAWFHPTFTGGLNAPEISYSSNGVDDLGYVKKLLSDNKVGPEIEYASRTIRYVSDAQERKSITEIDQELFPTAFRNITISRESKLPAGKIVDLHVKQSPRPDQVDVSDMIFAASTTYGRFTDPNTSPIEEWTRWLTDGHGASNGAGLILALFDTTSDNIAKAAKKLKEVGINATVVPSNKELDMAGRYVDLVQMIYNHPTRPNRKYLVLVDDDTFFPAISSLRERLSTYDPEKPFYIGTFTERSDWLIANGAPFAYGGGGIVLTAPSAKQIVEAPCLAKNNETGKYVLDSDQGDRLLYNCLTVHTDLTLTYLPTLHQHDQFGDPAGIYESGQLFHSIHHYKSWHRASPARTHVVADACGEECVYQRFQFSDNFIISNGFSIAHYPQGIDFDPLQMEQTFSSQHEPSAAGVDVVFSLYFGGLRKRLAKTGKKRSWEILGARKEGDGRVKQVYLKRWSDERWYVEGGVPKPEEDPRDSVVVLTWVP
ncbi:uncharacterized protein RSE6_10283 [Rhynchosporium secalis]|uniref:Fringe-like glycosyltransferase domain-containing protein n=1 Tax=Rhynchosporium secalis TaxID=38038 RepID=A0A1E1MK49_RHYSE|nr:uncharacterized protein RSE6_10283 [Rhynchosporium secalis]